MTCFSKSSQLRSSQVLLVSLIIYVGKLYFYSNRFEPEFDDAEAYSVLNIDNSIVYHGYNKDFGPLNLAGLHRYITQLQSRVAQDDKIVVHHTSTYYQKQANSCFLICAYQVIVRGMTPDQAFKPFKEKGYDQILVPYVDAGDENFTQRGFEVTVLDCLNGLAAGFNLKWYNPASFDLKTYENLYSVNEGDMNWIIPGQIMAFSSPIGRKIGE